MLNDFVKIIIECQIKKIILIFKTSCNGSIWNN